MSLNFLNPHLFWLSALVLVPILLHLFARTKPPVYRFSSVEFLKRIVKKTTRLKKPQDLLLLILRTLAVAALIAAFLQPLLFTQEKLSGLFQKKNLVLVVDASASMAYVEGAQTRFAKACAEAGELLTGLSAGDRANIVWLKAEPEAVFPDELASNLGYLRDRLRRAEVTYERGSIEKAFSLANELLAGTEGKREVCVVSDFQKSSWEEFEPTLPDDTDLIHVKIGRENAGNLAVTRLSTRPDRPIVGEELVVDAEVANFSDTDAETTIFSEAGENRRSRNLSVPAGQTATAIFRHNLTKAGPVRAKASLAEDGFPGDDQRSAAVQVRPYLRLAVVEGDDAQTAKLWTRAAQSLGWAVPERLDAVDLAEGKADEFDVVLLSGLGSGDGATFPESTKVILLPSIGDFGRTPGSAPPGMAESATDEPLSVRKEKAQDGLFTLSATGNDAGVLDLFRGDEAAALDGPAGTDRLLFDKPVGGGPLLVYGDEAPAVVRSRTNRFLWMIPLDETTGNFAGRAGFVPFFAELLLADRSAGGGGAGDIDYEPGETVFWQAGETVVDRDDLEVFSANGEPIEFSEADGGRFSPGSVASPQVLEWRSNGKPLGLSVVNFPASESNLETLSLVEAENFASVVVSGGGEVRNLRDGLKLWPWLLGGAVVFLLLETGVVLWSAATP
ncbi:MAG: BatA and WFA domain-containing protein [Verrucomicrobiales bacterium]